MLTVGMVYTGKVQAVSSINTYTVKLDAPSGQVIAGALLGSTVTNGILGFRDSRVLSVDTAVAVAYGNPSFIFSGLPSDPPDKKNGHKRSTIWGDPVSKVGDAGRTGSTNIPEDLVAGEFDYDNLFGVGIKFLTSLIAMKAGDRAQIECHLLNDMVRIVSQQFRHIHGLGDDLIFDHGRPTLERGYTSYRHELMGKLKESDALFELKGDKIKKESVGRIKAMARYRYLEFMGFAGDFIHRFVCDPPEMVFQLSSGNSGMRAGKAWEHFGSDGSYTLQSTAEIRLERVARIPVMYRKDSHESPKITKARRYRELELDLLKSWDYGSIAGKDAYRTAYQIRLYARWLTRFQAFSRALQLDSEYAVPSETAGPDPDWNNAEVDRTAANKDLDYFEAYSSYSILRDGSQVIHDGYGSSAVFSNGNVQISAARHLELEAAGDIRITCSSFFLKARRHIEMSASAGGIILHSFAFLRALCEKGSIHLRSDAKLLGAASPDSPKGGVTPPIQPVILESAILLEAVEGRTAVRSAKQISLSVEGSPTDPDSREEREADIILATNGSVRVRAGKYFIVGAVRDIITSSRHWAMKVSKWYGDVKEIKWDKFFLNPKSGMLQARVCEVDSLVAQDSIAGPLHPHLLPQGSKVPVGAHSNHISVRGADIVWKDAEPPDDNAEVSLDFTVEAKAKKISPWELGAPDAKWEFLGDTDYYWDSREERKGALIQTLTQQHILRDKPELWGSTDNYDSWSWHGDTLRVTKRTGINRVGFGGNAHMFFEAHGDDLHRKNGKSAKDCGDNAKNRSWTTNTEISMRLLKH